jgi:hypothetical protein
VEGADKLLLLIHAAATLFMVGLIWFVQVVHYPLFAQVGAGEFIAYAASHGQRTTYVVTGPMLVELITALLLVWRGGPGGTPPAVGWVGLGLVGVVWLSTFFLQVPQHTVLASGFQPEPWRVLVTSNWLRTAAWTARGGLVLYLLARAMRGGQW